MAANTVGYVVHIKGSVEVRAVDGTIKLLSLGDAVHSGEVVNTAASSELIIDFLNGKRLELAESSEALLDESVYRAHEFGSSDLFAEIAQVQQALLDGSLDINDLEPTAAGPGTAGGSSGGLGEGVVFSREGREGEVDSRGTPFDVGGTAGPGMAELGTDRLDITPTTDSAGATVPPAPDSPPVLTGLWTGSVAEGDLGDLSTTSGTLAISDPDPADSPSFTDGSFAGAYGTLALVGEDWTYTLDQSRVQNLDTGDVVADVIRMTATDGTTQEITVSILGTEDGPIITGQTTGVVTEDTTPIATGSLLATDVDDGDIPTFTVQPGTVTPFGTFAIDSTGDWSFTLNNLAAQPLSAGQTVTELFTVEATTPDGQSVTETVTITITGTNDGITAVADTGATDQDSVLSVAAGSGVLTNDSDLDGDTLAVSDVNGTGGNVGSQITLGSGALLTLNADGSYDYDPNGAFDGLAVGITTTDSFTYTAADGNGATATETVTITLTGTNDGITAVADTGATDQDSVLSVDAASGVLTNDSDLDGDTLAVSDVNGTGGNVGSQITLASGALLTLNADGSYDYDPNDVFDGLAVGATTTDSFTYTVTDGNGATAFETVTVTLTGTNDGITALADTGATDQNVTLSVPAASGVLNNDLDLDGDTLTVSDVNGTGGNVGSQIALASGALLTLNANGSYDYEPNGAFDGLSAGATATDSFTYIATDGNGATAAASVTLTITGTNDGIITTPDTGITDQDTMLSVAAPAGVLSNDIDLDGDTLTVTEMNGNGANVGSQIALASGALLTLNADGSYDYDPNGAFDGLAIGATTTDSFTYRATDGNGASTTETVTITLAGTNDGITAVADTGATDQDSILSVNAASGVLTNDSDLDGDTLTVSDVNATGGNVGTQITLASGALLTLNADGSYDYDPNDVFDGLAVGATTTDSFSYTVVDGNGASATETVTVTLSGTNDGITAVTDTGATDQDSILSVPAGSGVLTNDTDLDGDTLTVSDVNGTGGNVGSQITLASGALLTLNADGSYDYDPNDAFDSLAVGATTTDSFTYTVTDGNGESASEIVTVTLTGNNDGITAVADTGATDQDSVLSVNAASGVLSNDTDVDGDTLTVSDVNGTGGNVGTQITLGSGALLTLNADGSYDYDPNDAFDSLAVGATTTDSFTYTVVDGNGASATETVTVTLTGTNDGLTANPDTGGTDQDSVLSVNAASGVLSNDTDLDGDTLTVSDVNGTGGNVGSQITLGSGALLTLNADGSYDYDPNDVFDGLAVGATTTDSFTYTVTDGNGATATEIVTVTLTGTNDGITAVADTGATDQDSVLSVNAAGGVLTNDSDLDGDTLAVSDVNATGGNVGSQIALASGALLTLNADGSYDYDPNDAFDSLAVGATTTDSFTYTVVDGNGASATETVTVTLTGTNDGITANPDTGGTDQDSVLSVNAASGVLSNDTDLDGDTLTVSDVNATGGNVGSQITLGSGALLTLNADGSYDYDPNDAFDSLAVGATTTDSFTYTVVDGNGASATETVTVTLTGTNDGITAVADTGATDQDSVLSVNAASGVLSNDTDLDGDTLTVSDVNATGGNVGSQIALASGALLTLNADGSYDYDPNDAFDSLAVGATTTDSFTYTVVDGNGATASETVTVTLTGTNDGITAVADTGATDQDSVLSVNAAGGVLTNDTDLDGDTLTVSDVNATGGNVGSQITLGSGALLTLNADGSYDYDPNDAFDSLAVGATATDSFTYTVTDGNGATATETVTVTLTGTNDGITAVADTGATDQDSVLSVNATSGVLTNDTDLDGDTLTVSDVNATGGNVGSQITLGSGALLTLNADGSYDYDPNDAFDGLAVGATTTDSFTYTVTDGNGESATETVTVTLTGTNDGITAVADTGATDQDSVLSVNAASGVLSNDTDLDGDTLTVSDVNATGGNVGSQIALASGALLTLNADGSYDYDPNDVFDSLAVGATTTDSFTYTVVDGNGESATETVTVTLTGTNDGITAVADSGATDQNVALSVPAASGVLSNDTDLDGDTLTVSDVNATGGNVGSQIALASGALLTLNADGSYDYDPNGAFDGLTAGATATDSFSYTVTDGNGESATETVGITITGTNDGIITTPDTGITDQDSILSVPALAGVLSNDTDLDGDTLSVTEMNGVGANVGSQVALPSGALLTLNADGSYDYDPNGAFDGLAVGVTAIDSFTYRATDGNGASTDETVTITITGTNDGITAVADTGATDQDVVLSMDAVSGVLSNDTDLDGDTLTVSDVNGTGGNVGTQITLASGALLTLNADGSYDYDPNDVFDGLAVGATTTDSFTYTVVDGNGESASSTVTVTLTGTNDGITAVADTGGTDQDSVLSVNAGSGVLSNDTDLDGDTLTVSDVNGTGGNVGSQIALGSGALLTLNADGSYDYDPNDVFDGLAVGATTTDSFTYTVTDGNGATATETVTVTLTGTNDGITAVADTGATDQDSVLSVNATSGVLTNDTDLDGDTLTVSDVNATGGNVGSQITLASGALLTLNADGSYDYDPNDAFDSLAVGATTTDSFSYTVVDGNGASATETVTVTLTGTNDGITAVADTGATDQDSVLSVNAASGVLSNDTDLDGDTLTVSDVNATGGNVGSQIALGSGALLTLNADGSYDYDPNGVFDGLAVGATTTDSFSYTVVDGNGASATETVTVTLTGTNDGITANPDTGGTDQDSVLSVNAAGGVLSNDTDLDGDTLTVSDVNGTGGNVGSQITLASGALLTLNADGSYDYDPNDAFDSLAVGATTTDSFTYTVVDGNGASATETVTVTLTGTNDGITAVADTGATDQDSVLSVNAASGVLSNDTDLDGDTLAVSDVNATGGNVGSQIALASGALLTLNADGSYDYDPNDAFDSLAVGATTTDSFTYTVTDGNGATASETVTVTLTGTNDGITAVADTGATDQDSVLSVDAASGVLSNDTDLDGDTLAVSDVNGTGGNVGSQIALASGALLTLNADGSYDYDPNDAFDGLAVGATATDSFTYTVTDGNGATASETVTVTLTGTNDGITAVADTGATDQDSVLSVNAASGVLSNDTDLDGDTLTVSDVNATGGNVGSQITLASGALLTLNADGSYDYDPNGVFDGLAVGATATDSFSYTVTDGNGASAIETVTVTLTGTNDGITAVADTGATDQDSVLSVPAVSGVLSNDTDLDGDTLAVSDVNATGGNVGSQITLASGALLTLNADGSYDYDPNDAFDSLAVGTTTTDSFSYTVVDGNGASATETVTVTLTGTNDGITAVADTGATDQDSVLSVNAASGVLSNDTDLDGDTLAVSDVNGTGGNVGSQITLGSGALLTLNADGSYDYDPNNVFDGLAVSATATDSFSYTVTDGNGASAIETVTVTLTGTNDGITAVADTGATDQDSVLSVDAASGVLSNDTDLDGDTLAVSDVNGTGGNVGTQITLTSGALLTLNADGSYDYDPNDVFDGLAVGATTTDSFTYTVTDGNGATATETVTVTLTGTNDGITAVADTGATDQDSVLSVNAASGVLSNDTDLDGDTLTVSDVNGTGGNVGSQITLGSGALLTLNADGSYDYDPNNVFDGLAVSATATDSFSYTVTDGNGASAIETVTVTLTGTNDGITAVADTGATDQDSVLSVDAASGVLSNDTDLDGDTLAVSDVNGTGGNVGTQITLTSGALLTLNADGSYDYDPNDVFDGLAVGATTTDSFTYTVTDGNGATATETVTVTLTGTNDGITAVADTGATDQDSVLSVDAASGVLTNDTDLDGDTLTVSDVNATGGNVGSQITLASGALLTLNADGSYDYDPNDAFDGLAVGATTTDSFSYTVVDGNGASATETVTVTLTGTNDGITAVADTGATDQDSVLSVNAASGVLSNDTDLDGDTLTVSDVNATGGNVGSQIALASGALLTLNADGSYDYDPNDAFDSLAVGATTTDSFSYTVVDGNGASATETVTVTLTGTNDGITAVADTGATDQDSVLSVPAVSGVLSNDTDLDGDTLAVSDVNGTGGNVGSQITLASGALLTLNADGSYDYDPNDVFDGLAVGATTTDSFTYTVVDGNGASATETVTVTLTGTNDGITAVADTGATDQDSVLSVNAAGGVLTNDSDLDGDTLAVSDVNGTGGNVGSQIALASGALLTLNADGSYDYDPNDAFDGLAVGATTTDSFTYTVTDGNGATASETVTVTLTGTNDGITAVADTGATDQDSVLSVNATSGVLTNDTDLDGDTLTVSDVNATGGNVGSQITLASGALLTLNADGSYDYDPNDVFDGLAVGATTTDSFSYTVVDGNGASATETVTVTLTGTNDGITAVADTGTTDEDSILSVPAGSGVLTNDSDLDGDTLTVSDVNATGGNVGTQITLASGALLTLNADGSYDYDPNGAFNSLSAGTTSTDSFSYTVTDGNGATASESVTITLTGTNDGIITTSDSGSTDEDTVLSVPAVSGVLTNDTDLDGDTLTVSDVNGTGGNVGSQIALGSGALLTLNADGSYDYDPNGAFDSLAIGDTTTDSFTYRATDGSSASTTETVTITLTGTNDGITAVADTGATDQDAVLSVNAASGVLSNDTDLDGDTLTVSDVNATGGNVGSQITLASGALLTLNADGSYDYDPNDVFDGLAVGATTTDSFTYTVTDGNGATASETVTVTLTGTNDGITAVADTSATDQDSVLSVDAASGVLSNDTDLDGDTLAVSDVNGTGGNVGSQITLASGALLTLNADGSYDYDPNDVFDGLAVGATTTDSFTYTVTDGNGATATETVTVTLTGTNDGITAVADTGATDQDSILSVPAGSGVLTNDTDLDGDTLTVSDVNGTGGNVGSQITLGSGALLTLNADGSYDYDPNDVFDGLAVGATTTDSFTYTVVDGNGASAIETVTVTLTGTNDGITAVADTGATDQDSVLSVDAASGVLSNDTDLDGDTLAVSDVNATGGNVGTQITLTSGALLTLNADGSYDYDPNDVFDGLAVGATTTDSFTYTVTDGNGATATETVTVTLTGTNDGITAVADTGATDQDSVLSVNATSGVLTNDTDLDGDTLTVSDVNATGGNVGSQITLASGALLTLNADGSYDYDPNDAFDSLAVGATTTDSFTYTVVDGNGASATETVTVTLTGTNDGITAVADTSATDQDSVLSVNATSGVLSNDTDLDGDTLTVSDVNATGGNVGTQIALASGALLTLNADGSYDYDPNDVFDGLAVGATTTDSFSYTVVDGNGASATETVTVTLTGTNDGITAVADTGATDQDSVLSVNAAGGVLSNDTDLDGDTLTVSDVNGTGGNVGSQITLASGALLTLNADGSYDYDPNDAFDSLAVGATTTDSFTYTVVDGNGASATETVTVTLTGTNDGITANPDTGGTDQDSVLSVNAASGVLSNDTDLDGDTLTVSDVNGTGGNVGSQIALASGALLTLNADGSYDYDPNDAFDSLAVGATTTDSFTYTVTDGNGATASETVTVTLTGTNDGITAVADTGATDQDSVLSVSAVSGVLSNDTDLDGDTLAVSDVNATGGNVGSQIALASGALLTLNADGSYDYDPNDAFDGLAVGATATDSFTYTVTDGNGATASETVTVTLTGTNDGITAVADTGATDQDSVLSVNAASGVLSNDTDLDGDTLTVSDVNATGGNVGSQIALASGALLTLNADGSYDYDPNGVFDGLAVGATTTDSFTYTVTDGNGATASETVTVTLTGTNDGITAVADTGATDQDSVLSVPAVSGVLSNDTDLDGDTLAVSDVNATGGNVGSQIALASGALLTLNADGSYDYDPNDAFDSLAVGTTTTDSFSYTVVDGNGASATETVTVTLTGTNDGITAVADTGATDQDSVLSVNAASGVLSNDTDLDGDTLAVSDVNGTGGNVGSQIALASGALLTLNADGSYDYDPNDAFDGLAVGATTTDSFTYTVTDGNGATASETVTVTLTGTNDGITAVADTGATDQDSVLSVNAASGVLSNDTDLDGDTLAVSDVNATGGNVGSQIALASGALLTLNADGSYDYDPNDAFDSLAVGATTTDSFSYTVVDGNGASATETVTVTLTGTNDGITAVADTGATDQDSVLSVNAASGVLSNDTDLDGDTLTVSDVNGTGGNVGSQIALASGALLTLNADGSYDYDPNDVFDGLAVGATTTDSFSYTVTDSNGESASQTVTVTVTGTNDAPLLSGSTTATVYESGLTEGTGASPSTTAASGALTYSDVDGDALTLVVNGTNVGVLDGTTNIIGTHVGDYGTLEFKGDGTWKYSLDSAVNHLTDTTPFEQFDVTVTDGIETSSSAALRIDIGDDGLTVSSSLGVIDNAPGIVFEGALPTLGADFSYSADLSSNIAGWNGTTIAHSDSGMTSNGYTLYYGVDVADTSKLIAYTDTAGSNAYDASSTTQSVVFTVTADPDNDRFLFESQSSGNGLIDSGERFDLDIWDERHDSNVVVVYETPTGHATAAYDTEAEWMADIDVYENTIIRFEATSDDGSGNQAIDEVHWHGQLLAVDDHSIEGDKGQIFTMHFTSAPVLEATVGVQLISGSYVWSAYDADGNLLGTGTDTAASLSISGIGPISSISLEGADASSEFLVDDGGTSIVRMTNAQDIGPLNFSVDVADQDGNTASTVIGVTLENVAQPSTVTLTEDTQKVFSSEDFGILPNDTSATVTIYDLEDLGSLRLNGVNVVSGQTITKAQLDAGELTFDPLPNASGMGYDTFTFALNNSAGAGTFAAPMTIDVIPVDDGPIGPVVDEDAALNIVRLGSAPGTVVGLTAYAIDPDPEDGVTYSLKDDAGGLFAIDPTTGVVTVAGPLGSNPGTEEIEVLATSSDGTTTKQKFDIVLAGAADDFATVHESGLESGSGRAETVFDDNDEPGQNTGAGEPTRTATGNLLANDPGANTVTSIDGITPVGGIISIAGAHGTLTVDAATGDYTYTLSGPVDNSAAGDDVSVFESFTYVTDIGAPSDLTVTIIDDTPQTGDFITNVPEGQMSEYQLVLTLDVSGSMTGAQYDGVVYLPDGTQTTRLEMAKDALKALVQEYHSQSDAVAVHLVTFSSSAQVLNGGSAYTDLASTLAAIDGMGGSGGTNYEAGLDAMKDALDPDGDGNVNVTGPNLQTITYFISDGVPTSGDPDPVGATNWDNFTATNGVDSFAVGIGSGITDFSALNAIHNVDADASGTVDGAVYVPDLAKLEEELLSTVPASFGGSIVGSGAFQTVNFGADGGSITTIKVALDTDADGTPDTDVTFSYDTGSDTITNDAGLPTVSGSILPLDTSTFGFVEGKLIFDFTTGNYNYYQSASVTEGDSFVLTFTAVDQDGDITDPTTVTVRIVDGKPVANDDTDTLFALENELEGNVLTGAGTDGGVTSSSSFTTFSNQGVGVDNTVDDARVTSIEYRGDTIDLTTSTGGNVSSTAAADGSSYTYSVNATGELTLVNNTDTSTLVFNTDGYYRYTPSTVPNPPTASLQSVDFTNNSTVDQYEAGNSVNGVMLSSPDGTVSFEESGTQGAAVSGNERLNTGERLVIDFDTSVYRHGVQELVLDAGSLGSSYEVFNITAYHVDGHEMARTSVGDSGDHDIFSGLSGIGRIEIQAGSNTYAVVQSIDFRPVLEDTGAVAIAPEVIDYTLTDTDGDFDTATLTLKAVSNSYVDVDGDGVETGSAANDFIAGLDGDDTLSGGAGHDVVQGDEGDDALYGDGGDDVLVGGDGIDFLSGGVGDDELKGGTGDDELRGGDGDDTLRGNEGDDLLVGDAGADTLYGGQGDDTLQGGDGPGTLFGDEGNDILTGGSGVDFLSGGAGSDVLTGGAGADTFSWGENDRGSQTSPDGDTILDFEAGVGGDVLDLSDLLQDEETNPLSDYLSVTVDDFDNDGDQDTRFAVDSDGGIFFQPVLNVTLDGVDLSEGGTLTDQEMLTKLISDGNLQTDS